MEEKELLSIAASLENLSEHPLGLAIINEAKEQGLELAIAEPQPKVWNLASSTIPLSLIFR